MCQFVKFAISTLLIVLPFPSNARGLSHPLKFSNCKSMQSAYPLGIAKDKASAGLYGAKISAAIYMKHKNLDFDFDGIVCEKELVQASVTTTTTTTTTLVGMSSSVAPLGTWEDISFYDTKELVLGRNYRIYVCAGGNVNGWSMLEVQINQLWVAKAIAVKTTPSPLCGSAYPILHSYYWIADVSGPEPKTLVKVRLQGFSNSNETIRSVVKTPSQSTTSLPLTNTPIYTPPAPLISTTTTTTTPMPTLSFSEERFGSGTCYLISANLDMSSSFQCPGLSSLKLYGQPQKNYSFPAIFKRQYQWNGTNVTCSWNLGWALYFCS